jgi:sulfonate transport system substrate-binding protein
MRALKFTLAALTASFMLSAAQAEPVKIRWGWVAPVANWASMVPYKKDLAKHWGKTYTLETLRFKGTPPMVTAIANNEIEIGNLAYSTVAIAIENAKLEDLRVVGDEFQDGHGDYHTNNYAVLKDGPIKKIEDLKGKVVATNAMGAAVDIASRAMLKRHGLVANRDYTIVEAPFPTMRAMLKEHKAALVPNIPPFSHNPEMRKISYPLFTSKDALGPSQFIVWTMRKTFIDKHRAAVVDFFEDIMRIEHWLTDPKNHAEVQKIAAAITKRKPEQFAWVYTKDDYYRSPESLPDLNALQKNIDMVHDLGFVKAKLDVKKYTDLSMIKEAGSRMKQSVGSR